MRQRETGEQRNMERQKEIRQKVKTSSKGATDGKMMERGGIAIKEREKAGEEEGSRRREGG